MRSTRLMLIVGTNGTGKTTFCDEKLIQSALDNKRRVLIVNPDTVGWAQYKYIDVEKQPLNYTGVRKCIASPMYLDQYTNFRDGLLVFDDCRTFVRPALQNSLETLSIRRRQYGIDIAVVAHGLTLLPPAFLPYATDIFIFKTKDNIVRAKNKLLEYDKLLAAQQRINEHPDVHYYEWLKL